MVTDLALPTFDEGPQDGPRAGRPWRVLRLVGQALRLSWLAAPREVALCAGLQVVAAGGVVAQLLMGRSVLAAVVEDRAGEDLGDLVPVLIGLGVVTALVVGTSAILLERQRVLASLVERHVQDRILDVVARVPLADFEDPTFHDRLRRAPVNASRAELAGVDGARSPCSAPRVTVIPIAAVLFRIQPVDPPGGRSSRTSRCTSPPRATAWPPTEFNFYFTAAGPRAGLPGRR